MYRHTYNLRDFVPSSCHLLPRGAILCALEVQFGQQLMLKSVNARGCQIGVPPFTDVGLILGSLGHFLYHVCVHICVYGHHSLSSWSPAATWSSQIDSFLNPKSVTLDSNIGSWDSQSPSRVPEPPGTLKNDFCFNFCPILELVSVSICVRKRLFWSVFRMTVSARAAKVIRPAR